MHMDFTHYQPPDRERDGSHARLAQPQGIGCHGLAGWCLSDAGTGGTAEPRLSPSQRMSGAADGTALVVRIEEPSADYRGRIWATRQRPWVDRLASAWLIRRYVDPQAHILWLAHPADCPPDALAFDFDGATFSHVGSRVTFEVLAASFGLEQPAITRLGLLVHYLDVGGVQPPEAAGVESVLNGLRENIANDDQLLLAASAVFDGLLTNFNPTGPKP
jgi:hypothetical protein